MFFQLTLKKPKLHFGDLVERCNRFRPSKQTLDVHPRSDSTELAEVVPNAYILSYAHISAIYYQWIQSPRKNAQEHTRAQIVKENVIYQPRIP